MLFSNAHGGTEFRIGGAVVSIKIRALIWNLALMRSLTTSMT
jgi:hypothetical protein